MGLLIWSIVIYVVILVLLVFLRMKTGNRFEIKNSDIMLAIIPIALWLLLTGKIQKLTFGEFSIESAFVKASESKITPQVTLLKLPVEGLRINPKEGVGEIPRLIGQKTQALEFRMRYGGYYGPAIGDYLNELSKYPYLEYILIQDPDRKLIGMMGSRELLSLFQSRSQDYTAEDFARWINEGQYDRIISLPGFIPASTAVYENTNKQLALERMDSLNVKSLPVVDQQGHFIGIVDRSRLTASLIIDVAKQIK